MLDLETEGDFKNFNIERYETIVRYKTSFYTFHLPVASSIILLGQDTPEAIQACNEISKVLGLLFQVQVTN